MTPDEWHDLLDGQTFNVTREKGTERPWTSCLNDEKRNGTFYCACCTHPLFKSSTVRTMRLCKDYYDYLDRRVLRPIIAGLEAAFQVPMPGDSGLSPNAGSTA